MSRVSLVIGFVLVIVALTAADGHFYIRANQQNYGLRDSKLAVVLSNTTSSGAKWFVSTDKAGTNTPTLKNLDLVRSKAKWSSYKFAYELDFSAIQTAGIYYIVIKVNSKVDSVSLPINVTDDMKPVWDKLFSNSLYFFREQRDGANVDPTILERKPSHLNDRKATVYEVPEFDEDDNTIGADYTPLSPKTVVDMEGGWSDAGDYLKFVMTSSYTLDEMLLAYRDYSWAMPAANAAAFKDEVTHGIRWLLKAWDIPRNILYFQVGNGQGNTEGTYYGDHDLWRLPEVDDARVVTKASPDYYLKYRPVFSEGSHGAGISPNLVGRVAGAFALCHQVFQTVDILLATQCYLAAKTIYPRAAVKPAPEQLTTALPFDFYPEEKWQDDMAFGATQLYLSTNDPHYLKDAAKYLDSYMDDAIENGNDPINLYDIGVLSAYELYNTLLFAGDDASKLAVSTTDLINFINVNAQKYSNTSSTDPFRSIQPYQWDQVPQAFGGWTGLSFWQELVRRNNLKAPEYAALQTQQRDWMFGMNAFSASFIVGAGINFPKCMQHVVANLKGSINGSKPILLGATVSGSSLLENFEDLGLYGPFYTGVAVLCPPEGQRTPEQDPYLPFYGNGVGYADNVASWPTVEPADDYTVAGTYLFARLAAQSFFTYEFAAPLPTVTLPSVCCFLCPCYKNIKVLDGSKNAVVVASSGASTSNTCSGSTADFWNGRAWVSTRLFSMNAGDLYTLSVPFTNAFERALVDNRNIRLKLTCGKSSGYVQFIAKC